MKPSQYRWVAAAIAVAVIATAVLWFRSRAGSGAPMERAAEGAEKKEPPSANAVRMAEEAQKNIALRAEPAETRRIVQTIRTTGTVGANENRLAHGRPLTRGRILKVNVQLGDQVRADQVLATYDNIELGEALGQYGVYLAQIEKARTEAELAKRSADRARNLVELGAVARAEFERRNAEVASAQASIENQRAELARVEEKLHRFGLDDAEIKQMTGSGGTKAHREASQTSLTAPFAGIITQRNVTEGETVETDRELFTIADLSVVWVQANIYESDVRMVRKGVAAAISVDAYPDTTFNGRITYISDMLDPKTRTVKVRCEVPNPDGRLKLEMFANVDIPTPTGRDATMIRAAAIQRINDQPVVFVQLNATEFQKRLVTLGAKDGDWVEVVTGIKAGEPVVTAGSFQLKSAFLRALIGEEE